MTAYTHDTVPTQFVEANGIRFAYRRFGKTGGVPLVMNVHFRGTMDHWDPAVTDGLALERLACGGDDEADTALLVEALVALGSFYLPPSRSPGPTSAA